MVCDKHEANPVKIYDQCVGCEIERLRKERDLWKNGYTLTLVEMQTEQIEQLQADKAAALEAMQRVSGTLQWGDAENAIERADIILKNAIARLESRQAIETTE